MLLQNESRGACTGGRFQIIFMLRDAVILHTRDFTGNAVVLGAMVHTYAPLHRVTLGWQLPWRCLGCDALPTHTWGHLPTNASQVLGCIHSVLFSRGEKCPLGISKASPGSERRGSWLPHLSYPTSSSLLWVLPEGP